MFRSVLQSGARLTGGVVQQHATRLLSTAPQQAEASATGRSLRNFFLALVPIGVIAGYVEWEHKKSVADMQAREAAAAASGEAPPPRATVHGGKTSHGVQIDTSNPLHKILPETECEYCLETREKLWGMVKAMKHDKKAAAAAPTKAAAAAGEAAAPAALAAAAQESAATAATSGGDAVGRSSQDGTQSVTRTPAAHAAVSPAE